MTKKTTESAQAVQAPLVPISSIYVSEDIPNRRPGWETGLKSLVESLEVSGQISPINLVEMPSPGPNGETYRLVDGFRRLMAHKALKRTTIKAITMSSKMTKKGEFLARVAANEVRIGNTPLEQAALAYYGVKELGIPQHEYAKSVGKTSSWVSQRLAALKQPTEIQEALEKGSISFTHVRALARVKDEDNKLKLLKKASKIGATDFEQAVDEFLDTGEKPKAKKKKKEADGPTDILDVGHNAKVRAKKEINGMLARCTKAFQAAKANDDKNKATELSGFMKGVSWTIGWKGGEPPV